MKEYKPFSQQELAGIKEKCEQSLSIHEGSSSCNECVWSAQTIRLVDQLIHETETADTSLFSMREALNKTIRERDNARACFDLIIKIHRSQRMF